MSIMKRLLRGAGAGVAATGAMSAVLGVADKIGAMEREPPRIIVASLLPVDPTSTLTNALAVVAHVGYGTSAGMAFTMLPGRLPQQVPAGVAYGALIYLIGYEGWLPAMGILPPAHRDKRGRVVTMLAAHLVYGAALARANRKAAELTE
jgi:hypothetical protein